MPVAVKDVGQAIRDNKPTDMHSDMYNAVMNMLGFAKEDLMAALSHLVDHKAQGCIFVGMIEPHRVLYIRNYLAQYHYKL
jgi:UDP-N-acetyl-D-mannosaminuronic acid transferase (WecB/TagA/CpsF family)